MRTEEDFAKTFKELKRFIKLHKKPVWLVPKENKYVLSIIKPSPDELPIGTAANLYNTDLNVDDSVKSAI